MPIKSTAIFMCYIGNNPFYGLFIICYRVTCLKVDWNFIGIFKTSPSPLLQFLLSDVGKKQGEPLKSQQVARSSTPLHQVCILLPPSFYPQIVTVGWKWLCLYICMCTQVGVGLFLFFTWREAKVLQYEEEFLKFQDQAENWKEALPFIMIIL